MYMYMYMYMYVALVGSKLISQIPTYLPTLSTGAGHKTATYLPTFDLPPTRAT